MLKNSLLILNFLMCITLGANFALAQTKAPVKDKKTLEATSSNSSTALSSDALSAKLLLEEIIVRRYTQDLATRITKDSFSMGAQLEIIKLAMEDIPAQEPMTDLMLGMLDPDELVKAAANQAGAKEIVGNFLSQYSIKNVAVSVGLNQDLVSEEKKTEVTTWLSNRLKQEFGSNGKSSVNLIQIPKPAKPEVEPKTFLDKLKDLQDLAGQIVLALAVIIGSLLWGVLSRPKSHTKESVLKTAGGGEVQSQGAPTAEQKARDMQLAVERRITESSALKKEIAEITERLVLLVPKTTEYFESILRNWCELGESGRFRLVCFAEAVRQDLGKLPIPVDAVEGVKKIFSQMPSVQLQEKRDALDKVYWDLLAAMNLGSDALTEPFSYLGGVNVDTVQNVLMEKNAKLRTLVALYMPDELRGEYVRSLDAEKKKELLASAAQMQSIPASEFKTIDRQIAMQLKAPSESDDLVKLEMTLQKIVSSFTPIDQILNLREIPPEALTLFKRSSASLAFLDEWPAEPLTRLISIATTDEIVNYIKIVPSAQDKILALCRPMTAKMVKDELNRSSTLSDTQKNRLLETMLERLQNLLEEKTIDLERDFPKQPPQLRVA